MIYLPLDPVGSTSAPAPGGLPAAGAPEDWGIPPPELPPAPAAFETDGVDEVEPVDEAELAAGSCEHPAKKTQATEIKR